MLHQAAQAGRLASTGPYARVRHPQYGGLLLIMTGFLVQWPTIPALAMFPVLVLVYLRLARNEEREVAGRLRDAWAAYAARTPDSSRQPYATPSVCWHALAGGPSHDRPVPRRLGGVMVARTARKRKVTSRPSRPRPATTARPLALSSAVPGSPASRGTPPPAGLAPRGPAVALAPVGAPSASAGTGDAIGRAEHEVLRPVVTATCWVDPGERGMPPYDAVIRFTGHRAGVTGKPSPADRFEREEAVRLIPGSGPVAITTRAENVSAGEWVVRASPASRPSRERTIDPSRLRDGGRVQRLGKTLWTKGNPVTPTGPGTPVRTRVAALASPPGIITGAWTGFVVAGLAAALAMLVVLLARVQAGAGGALAVALAASLAGAAGARGWYVMLQRGKVSGLPTRGLCIQGFIAGAVVAGIPGLLLAGIPVGTFFDAAAPGVFFAMAIGRQGCFFTGCCAGRPTGSRWGIWSSDGRIGARRIPAQQLESLVCLLIGTASLAAFLRFGTSAGGAIFVGAMAAYTLARQGLLALRAEPRRWALARPVTLAAATAALFADLLIATLR